MTLLALPAALLLMGAALLVLRETRAEQKRLRERSASQAMLHAKPGGEAELTIIAAARPRESALRRLGAWLGFADSTLGPRRISLPFLLPAAMLVGGAAFWQATFFFGGFGFLAGIAVSVFFLRAVYKWEQGRNRDLVFSQIPDAVGLMVRAVRAGLPVGEAVRSVAREMPEPTRSEFQRVLAEVAIGVPLDRALWSIHERTGLREYAFLSVVIGLQSQTGGSLAEALENLGDIVRQRMQMGAKAAALASQARASAMILLALPPIGGLLMALTQDGYIELLFYDPRGLKMLGIAVGLMLVGTLVIRGLLRQASSE